MTRTLAQGQVFAGYRIERLLGAGGMGEVYLARDRDLPRFTALKVLSPAFGDSADARRRFLLEADTVARLSHPNIVTVYARGQEGDRLWMAMQYIEGTDVAAVLQNGPIYPEHAVAIVGAAAGALDFAHRSGVLHRDVKPANILLAQDASQQAFLADFGIAKLMDHTSNLTRVGEVHASFRYAAPEQLDSTATVDQRADVYALGCTLFHMLTGAPPYPGTAPSQLIHGHLNLPVPRPSQYNPQLPPGFDAVIAGALAKHPQQRYNSCGDLAAAARYALSGNGIAGDSRQRPAGSGRKWGWIAGAIVALLILLGAGGTVGFLLYQKNSADDSAHSADAAKDAACAFGRAAATYDYDKWDTYRKAMDDGSTGDLKADFQNSLPTLQSAITTQQAHAHATDAQCFMKNADSDRVEVATIVNQVSTTQAVPTEKNTQLSLLLTMEYVDGRWLAAKMDQLAPQK
ncbi:serine/threonine-protein kinase [Nocardia sp. NPDC052254]|uniref:serine/threonine-protein kinase n=1 Tax=Nocardia sp. NPDC052254 TaxID=3155681 RepID=UPI003417938D